MVLFGRDLDSPAMDCHVEWCGSVLFELPVAVNIREADILKFLGVFDCLSGLNSMWCAGLVFLCSSHVFTGQLGCWRYLLLSVS